MKLIFIDTVSRAVLALIAGVLIWLVAQMLAGALFFSGVEPPPISPTKVQSERFERVEFFVEWNEEPVGYAYSVSRRDVRRARGLAARFSASPMIPVLMNDQLVSQWTYDESRQLLAGRKTSSLAPEKSDARIGYLGGGGLENDPAAVEPLGEFLRATALVVHRAEDVNVVFWQTTDSIYLLDLGNGAVLFHEPWSADRSTVCQLPIFNSETTAAVGVRRDSGEWSVWLRSAEGDITVRRGSEAPGDGVFGIADGSLYFKAFESAEYVALYAVEQDGAFTFLERDEWQGGNNAAPSGSKYSGALWRLVWRAAALAGLFLYQRRRKMARAELSAWAVLTLIMGPPGLLACWIACHRKKGVCSPPNEEIPQHLLIAE
jgi:hypothetical protein